MSRLNLYSPDRADMALSNLSEEMSMRLRGTQQGICPVDFALNFVRLSLAQSCGKCTPCRIGLAQLAELIERIADNKADEKTLKLVEDTANVIADSADCAIGRSAAQMVLTGLKAFSEDYESHVKNHRCKGNFESAVPCVAQCPAHVDIPGYIALVAEERNADAVRLIRKDNPFPVSCAYICEHPCELHCRRQMVDSAVNIRGLKKHAIENCGDVPVPACAENTGKHVAVIGGGPSGLTCAYFLRLMGHDVTVFESHKQLGGMLRYGIPSYRFPREELDREIKSILSLGIEVKLETKVGEDISFDALKAEYDCIYIAIGAQNDKRTGMDGEDAEGVVSAVELLGGIGDGDMPDFTGKKVVVIGGGNVAMDATRSSIRLGAEKVSCVYRRRMEDMTAAAEEVEGALAEGAEMVTLEAPARIEKDAAGHVIALITQPQMISAVGRDGRPAPKAADLPERRIEADICILAIGQSIDSKCFEEAGLKVNRGSIVTAEDAFVTEMNENGHKVGIYSGGDCVSGPATAIKAIAAGKVAAANIDEYLGFNHEITCDVEIPAPKFANIVPSGRINVSEREALERKKDFECIECPMTCESSKAEASRCLGCDHFGYGKFKGGRNLSW